MFEQLAATAETSTLCCCYSSHHVAPFGNSCHLDRRLPAALAGTLFGGAVFAGFAATLLAGIVALLTGLVSIGNVAHLALRF
ncbi:MAG: hypothetical protein JKP98_10830 [Rhodobacteraceae bacterium]|nr:hypothetical protein [Paracoccaceae bacterium]